MAQLPPEYEDAALAFAANRLRTDAAYIDGCREDEPIAAERVRLHMLAQALFRAARFLDNIREQAEAADLVDLAPGEYLDEHGNIAVCVACRPGPRATAHLRHTCGLSGPTGQHQTGRRQVIQRDAGDGTYLGYDDNPWPTREQAVNDALSTVTALRRLIAEADDKLSLMLSYLLKAQKEGYYDSDIDKMVALYGQASIAFSHAMLEAPGRLTDLVRSVQELRR